MRVKLSFLSFLVLAFLAIPSLAAARITISPDDLICPDTRVDQSSTCRKLYVTNTYAIHSAYITAIHLVDDTNFEIISDDCTNKRLIPIIGFCTVQIQFQPSLKKHFLTGFSVDVDWEEAASSAVEGTGIAPIVTLSTNFIDFGDQTIGEESLQAVLLTNDGSDSLTIDDISVPLGSGFSESDNCSETIEVGGKCTILVGFLPTQVKDYNSIVTITDDALDSPQTISVTGNGIEAGHPDVSLSKTVVDFYERLVRSSSEDTVTVKNIGNANLTITSITATGDYFTVTDDCPATLAHDETCTITITFEPETVGSFSGTITLTDNATDSPQTITMMGQGIAPQIWLSTSEIDFGDQTLENPSSKHEVILLNSGTSDLTIAKIETDNTVFAEEDDCGDTVYPQDSCSIYVTFTPTALGEVTGKLSVFSNATGLPRVVDLTGTGVDPKYPDIDITPSLWDFGGIVVGKTSPGKEFLVENTGDTDLLIYSITANSDFNQTNDCPSTLAAEETCTIVGTFKPEAGGNFQGTITIVDNATDSPQKVNLWGYGESTNFTLTPNSIDFGDQTTGKSSAQHQILLVNTGNTALTIGDIATAKPFTQTNNCGETLAPAANCSIYATFSPTTQGEATGAVSIVIDEETYRVDLSGNGIDPKYPDIDITPDLWDFGAVNVGDISEVKEFTVTNTGAVSLRIFSITPNSDFDQTNDCPTTLAAGDTCTVSATFTPQAAGRFTGVIKFADNATDSPQEVELVGRGLNPASISVSLSVTTLNFGNIKVNNSSAFKTVTVTNTGEDDLYIGGVTIEGDGNNNFSERDTCEEATLETDETCTIEAKFSPKASGAQNALINIYDNAGDSPQRVLIKGTGTSSGSSSCNLMASAMPSGGLFAYILIAPLVLIVRRLYKRR